MTDALVQLLNGYGYQPVFLPRSDLKPPALYTFSRRPARLVLRGPLGSYLPAGVDVSPSPGKTPDIEYKSTSGKNQQAAGSFLQNALKCIGIDGAPKLDLTFTGQKELVFSFTGVTVASVLPARIDQVVSQLALGAVPAEYAQGGEIHIAYEYLYANELLMSRVDGKKFEHDVGASIASYLDIGLKGKVEVRTASTLSFAAAAGGPPAAFAFKAGQLIERNGRWSFFPEEVMQGDGPSSRPRLVARGVVLVGEAGDAAAG
jgi:hypothetical protein